MELSNKSMRFFNDTADSSFVSRNISADQLYGQKDEDEAAKRRQECDEKWSERRKWIYSRQHQERSKRSPCPPYDPMESTRLEGSPHVVVPDFG